MPFHFIWFRSMYLPAATIKLPLIPSHCKDTAAAGTDASPHEPAQLAKGPLKLEPGVHSSLRRTQQEVRWQARSWSQRLRKEFELQAKHAAIAAGSRLLTGVVAYYAIRMALPEEQRNDFLEQLQRTVTDSGVPGGQLVSGLLKLLSNHPIAVLGLSGITSWSHVINEMQGAFSKILETAVSRDDSKLAIHQRWQAQLNWLTSAVDDDSVRNLLPKEMLEELDRIIETLRASVFNTNSPVHVNYDHVESDWDKAFTLLSFPVKTTDVFQHGKNGDPDLASKIDRKVDEILKRYDPKTVAEPLRAFMLSVREWFNTRQETVPVAFLTSPPATGKTTAVMQLCEAIGATPVVVSMKDVAEYLNESKSNVFNSSDKARSDVYGTLVTKIIETCNTRNYIIFVDEVNLAPGGPDVKLADELKKWCDPENSKHPKIPGFRFRPDFRAPVVFASNYGVESGALYSRFAAYIEFPSWTEEQFEELTRDYFQAEFARRREEENFNKDVIDSVRDQLEEVVDFILEEQPKFGVTIREVKSVIADFIRTSLVNAAGGIATNVAELKEGISRRFKAIADARPGQTAHVAEVVETVTETRTEQTFETVVGPVVRASAQPIGPLPSTQRGASEPVGQLPAQAASSEPVGQLPAQAGSSTPVGQLPAHAGPSKPVVLPNPVAQPPATRAILPPSDSTDGVKRSPLQRLRSVVTADRTGKGKGKGKAPM